MSQDEARIRILGILKENIKIHKRKLIYLHLFTVAFFVISIALAGMGIVDLKIMLPINVGVAAFYAGLLGKFLTLYSTHKNGIKRLEAGFEEDFDYLKIYEEYKITEANKQKKHENEPKKRENIKSNYTYRR